MKPVMSTGESRARGGCSRKSLRSRASTALLARGWGSPDTPARESRRQELKQHLPVMATFASITVLQTPTTHDTLGVRYF